MLMDKNTYNKFLKAFEDNQQNIMDYIPKLKEAANFKDFNTRLAWDCINAFIGTTFICGLYCHTPLNDVHITTGAIKALKQLNLI